MNDSETGSQAVRHGFTPLVRATTVDLQYAGAGAVLAAGDVSFENAGAQAVLARGNVNIENGGTQSVLAGGDVGIRNGGAAVVASVGPVEVHGGVVGFVLSPRADLADSRVIFGPAAALLFGAGIAAGLGLLTGRRRRSAA